MTALYLILYTAVPSIYTDGQCIIQCFSNFFISPLVSLPLYEIANGNLFFALSISSSAVIPAPHNPHTRLTYHTPHTECGHAHQGIFVLVYALHMAVLFRIRDSACNSLFCTNIYPCMCSRFHLINTLVPQFATIQ